MKESESGHCGHGHNEIPALVGMIISASWFSSPLKNTIRLLISWWCDTCGGLYQGSLDVFQRTGCYFVTHFSFIKKNRCFCDLDIAHNISINCAALAWMMIFFVSFYDKAWFMPVLQSGQNPTMTEQMGKWELLFDVEWRLGRVNKKNIYFKHLASSQVQPVKWSTFYNTSDS